MSDRRFSQPATSALDYGFDWSRWLDVPGGPDALASVAFSAEPAGLTVQPLPTSGGVAAVLLSGGAPGTRYTVTCQVATTGGRAHSDFILLDVL